MKEVKRGIYAGTLCEVSYKDNGDDGPVPEFVRNNVGAFALALMKERDLAQMDERDRARMERGGV